MALDVVLKEELLNALRGVRVASEGSAAMAAELLEDPDLQGVPLGKLLGVYRRGFDTALEALALSCGLDRLVRESAIRPVSRGQSTGREPAAASGASHSHSSADLVAVLWSAASSEKQR